MRDGGTVGSTRARESAALASGAWVALAAILAIAAAGCGQVNDLKAKKAMKNANAAYAAQDYKKAADLYEEAVQAAPDSQEAHEAYFYLGNCYDNLWKPSRKGEADNDALLTKAVNNYEKAADVLAQSPEERDKNLGKLSLQYLVAAYSVDKLNDPSKQEPIVQKMIQLDPSDVTNYFALAKIYEDAGVYDDAEQMLLKAKETKPNDPDVYAQLAGYYNRQGQFDKTIDALQQGADKDPKNPTAHFVIATYYWDDAQKNFRLTPAQKADHVQKGLAAVNEAIQLNPNYVDALVYKGLLLRLEANMEKDPKKQADLMKEAVALHDKAEALSKQKAAGVSQPK
jgi:tetratricopeptide (TPR) repeat protein